jgi:hypothetical protein
MSRKLWSALEIQTIADGLSSKLKPQAIIAALKANGCTRTIDAITAKITRLQNNPPTQEELTAPTDAKEGLEMTGKGDDLCITCKSYTVRTLDGVLETSKVDLSIWEVERWVANKWDCVAKVRSYPLDADGKPAKNKKDALEWQRQLAATELWQVKVWFKRKKAEIRSLDLLLDELRAGPIVLPVYNHKPQPKTARALEISVVDPHLGLMCDRPHSDTSWSLDACEQAFMSTVEKLVELAAVHGPFDKVVAPIGNDFLHADNYEHKTTGGTPQPEMHSYHTVWLRGQKLLLWYVEKLRSIAPVEIKHVPGNHDRISSFTLANVVKAYYEGAKAKDVNVDASPSPYKFWQYGINLIGFEHGHSVNSIRLAALMANETRLHGWRDARYCEWHLGDQHRKGSSKPSTFEEQGVSVEYLPSLTPPNEWHRIHAFNWQKRGAMAFVYDKAKGPVARLQINFDNYTGKHLGE